MLKVIKQKKINQRPKEKKTRKVSLKKSSSNNGKKREKDDKTKILSIVTATETDPYYNKRRCKSRKNNSLFRREEDLKERGICIICNKIPAISDEAEILMIRDNRDIKNLEHGKKLVCCFHHIANFLYNFEKTDKVRFSIMDIYRHDPKLKKTLKSVINEQREKFFDDTKVVDLINGTKELDIYSAIYVLASYLNVISQLFSDKKDRDQHLKVV